MQKDRHRQTGKNASTAKQHELILLNCKHCVTRLHDWPLTQNQSAGKEPTRYSTGTSQYAKSTNVPLILIGEIMELSEIQ